MNAKVVRVSQCVCLSIQKGIIIIVSCISFSCEECVKGGTATGVYVLVNLFVRQNE